MAQQIFPVWDLKMGLFEPSLALIHRTSLCTCLLARSGAGRCSCWGGGGGGLAQPWGVQGGAYAGLWALPFSMPFW